MEQIAEILSPSVSGVLVSPEYSFGSILKKDNKAGLLLGLERRALSLDPMSAVSLIPNWGVEHVRNNYALAKLELYYNLFEPEFMTKKQLVAEVYEYCQMLGIDFLLELKIFPYQQQDVNVLSLHETQMLAIEDFRGICNLIALEFPGDLLSAVTLTAGLDIPWIMVNGTWAGSAADTDSYEAYKENLRLALESGARGFLAGNLIWRDILSEILHPVCVEGAAGFELNPQWLEEFSRLMKTKVRDRMVELCRITNEAGHKTTT
jgi:tagatose-1,6-bisphosphate aldolase